MHTECPHGFFGDQCLKICSKYCSNNLKCNHISGDCFSGCKDGYLGRNCSEGKHLSIIYNSFVFIFIKYVFFHNVLFIWFKGCVDGYYGANCSRICPESCKKCRNTDGVCESTPGEISSNTSEGILLYKIELDKIVQIPNVFAVPHIISYWVYNSFKPHLKVSLLVELWVEL